jgi:hypothetical protein
MTIHFRIFKEDRQTGRQAGRTDGRKEERSDLVEKGVGQEAFLIEIPPSLERFQPDTFDMRFCFWGGGGGR